MVHKFSISAAAPYLALLACLWSTLFPSRDLRLVRSLRTEVDEVRADNAKLRTEVAGVVRFIRDDLSSVLPRSDFDSGAGAAPDGVASAPVPELVPGGRYMVSRGKSGFSVGSDWWLVGDHSPWGVVDDAFRGGFTADGRLFTFVSGPSRLEGIGD